MTTTSADQRRDQARRAFNAALAECLGHDLLSALSDKWLTLVVAALAGGPLRYGELSRAVAGASQKMLTQTLRKLERDGLVAREVTAAVPVQVTYELTGLGLELLPLQRAVKAWAEAHVEQVRQARADYDGVAGSGSPD